MKDLTNCQLKAPNILIWIVCLIVGSALGTFAFYLLSLYVLGDDFVETMLKAHGVLINAPQEAAFTQKDQEALNNLIRNGHILTQDQLISIISQFYSDIINQLLMVIAALGVLGFLYVKGISKHEAQTIASEEAKQYTSTKWFKQEIIDGVLTEASKEIDTMRSDLEDLIGDVPGEFVDSVETKIAEIEEIKQKISTIEEKISKIDNSEEEGSDINLEN